MPIEIRELNIKSTISENSNKSMTEIDINEFKQKIMAECVENVLQILEDKKKR